MTPSASNPSHTDRSIGRKIAFGTVWVVGGAVAGKFVGVGVQIVLGWILLPEDFAVFASALGLNLVSATLIDGGTERFLLRSGANYGRMIRASTRVAVFGNLLAGVLVLGIAAWVWTWRSDSTLAGVLVVMALQSSIRTPVSLERIRLRHAMRFGAVARVEVLAIAFRGISSVMLAALGFGPFALVAPLVGSLPLEWLLLRRHTRGLEPPIDDEEQCSVREVVRSTRWIVAANAATTLAGRGDYLALTIAAPKVLGIYFFGFQIAVASLQLFMLSLRSVLLPGLSIVDNEPDRLRAVIRKAMGIANLLIPPMCIAIALSSPALMHLVWEGRWDESIVVVQAVAISTALRAASPVSFALMEARGRWVRVAVINALDGVTLVTAVLLGTWWYGDNLAALVWIVAAQRAAVGIGVQWSSLGLIGVGAVERVGWLVQGLPASAIGLLAAGSLGNWPGPANVAIGVAGLNLAMFMLGWAIYSTCFERERIRGTIALLVRPRGTDEDEDQR